MDQFEIEFKNDLKGARTLREFLDVCGEYYDLDQCELGFIAKATLANNINAVLKIAGAKKRLTKNISHVKK